MVHNYRPLPDRRRRESTVVDGLALSCTRAPAGCWSIPALEQSRTGGWMMCQVLKIAYQARSLRFDSCWLTSSLATLRPVIIVLRTQTLRHELHMLLMLLICSPYGFVPAAG